MDLSRRELIIRTGILALASFIPKFVKPVSKVVAQPGIVAKGQKSQYASLGNQMSALKELYEVPIRGLF